jgi:flagellar biosynthesis protein FliR
MPFNWDLIQIFIITLARTTAFIFVLPVLGNRSVPLPAKVSLSVILAWFMLSIAAPHNLALPTNLFSFFVLVSIEVFIGLALGFITQFIFAGVLMAGEVIGRQVGFALARVIDPGFQLQQAVLSQFYLIIMFLIYLTINGHHFLIEGLAHSYENIPAGTSLNISNPVRHIVNMGGAVFISGIKISAPVLAALLLTNVALGVLARTVPQMNIFMLGMPLKILVGILAMMMSIRLFAHVFQAEWARFQEAFTGLIYLF